MFVLVELNLLLIYTYNVQFSCCQGVIRVEFCYGGV